MIKFFSIITIYFSFILFAAADIQEILIKPSNDQYTRLSSGLAGSNITIIDESELKNNYDKNLPQILELSLIHI